MVNCVNINLMRILLFFTNQYTDTAREPFDKKRYKKITGSESEYNFDGVIQSSVVSK